MKILNNKDSLRMSEEMTPIKDFKELAYRKKIHSTIESKTNNNIIINNNNNDE